MDRYKKKNIKFMGKGSEVRAAEMNAARGSVRQQRFSLQRPLEEADVPQPSKLPTLGIPKPQSRLDMLNKWKAEKEFKKKLEMNLKKPAFKVGSARSQLDTTGLSRLQESKTESFNSTVLTTNSSISKVLKASRIQPVSKLADIHSKEPKLEAGAKPSVQKTIPTKSIPSAKPQIARLQVNKTKSAPSTKPQITKPQASNADMNKPFFKSSVAQPQTRQNLVKNTSAPSNFKPQVNTGIKSGTVKNTPVSSNLKPASNNGVKQTKISKPLAGRNVIVKEDKKIPTSGVKPTTFLPQRKLPLQNKQEKTKPVSSVQPKKTVKAVEPPVKKNPEVKKATGSSVLSSTSSSEQNSLFPPCQMSAIEAEVPPKEASFAPADYEFCPPKLRNSWLDNDGPYAIFNKLRKEMKQRTSTPIKEELKKHQELESSFKTENSTNTGESSKDDIKDYSTIPNSNTKYIESLIDSPAPELPVIEVDKKTHFTFSICDNPEDTKASGDSSDVENQACEMNGDSSVNKENLDLPEKVNRELVFGIDSPVKNQKLETSTEEKPLRQQIPFKELTDNVPPFRELCPKKAVPPETPENVNDSISVFYPPKPAADVPEKSGRRVLSNYWKIGKPSLALIRESPETSADAVQTPKSHRRKGLLVDEFTPRRSLRLARKSELKMEEEDIFNVKECFLDSPSVDAATRMSMMAYDFDKLHLEPPTFKGMSDDSKSASTSRGKVSLLYTPPRLRASTRNKSIKGDLMSFSPNVE